MEVMALVFFAIGAILILMGIRGSYQNFVGYKG